MVDASGLKRVEAKIGLANLACNFQRLISLERHAAMACIRSNDDKAPRRE